MTKNVIKSQFAANTDGYSIIIEPCSSHPHLGGSYPIRTPSSEMSLDGSSWGGMGLEIPDIQGETL